jgi:antitoxin MazE
MKLNIIKIGNSLGIRLPKSLIKQCHFKDSVQVKVKDGALILMPSIDENPRKGWNKKFKKMAQMGDDKLLDSTLFELKSDKDEWKW